MGLPTRQAILRYWLTRIENDRSLNLFIDIGEPTCWACEQHWDGKYDIKSSEASLSDCFAAWDKSNLQRCHIVASSLGGTDTVDNLYLMCRECHDLAPNTSIPEIFFEWVSKQCLVTRKIRDMQQALSEFGIDFSDENILAELNDLLRSPEFREWRKRKVETHWRQTPPRGPSITIASQVGLLVHYQRSIHGDEHKPRNSTRGFQ